MATVLSERRIDDWQLSASNRVGVQLEQVSKSFGDNNVLRNVSIEIDPGQFVAVVGKSGCGKSTLLRLLAGLEASTSGTILVDGSPLIGLNTRARVMFQDARLMPWMRVLENVGLGQTGSWRERAEAALADVGLESRGRDWPSILSGGQRQRVALARALASQAGFLLLDEPLGSLDALTRLVMQGLLERVWLEHGFTALLITHDVDEAVSLADRVILIEDGGITLDLAVDLPRPRDRSHPKLIALREEVLSRVMRNGDSSG